MRTAPTLLIATVALLLGSAPPTCAASGRHGGGLGEVFLSWVDGPATKFSTPSSKTNKRPAATGSDRLALRSTSYAMLVDARGLTISRLTAKPPLGSPATLFDPAVFDGAVLDHATPESAWHASTVELTAEIDSQKHTARMRPRDNPIDKEDRRGLHYPVRIIESGNTFQHLALHGLEWVAPDGTTRPASGRMELRAWGDRGVLEVTLDPEAELRNVEFAWRSPGAGFERRIRAGVARSGEPTTLRIGFVASGETFQPWEPDTSGVAVRCGQDRVGAEWNPSAASWELQLGQVKVVRSANGDEPGGLDHETEIPFVVENSSDSDTVVNLRFLHPRHPITGFVPLLLDDTGKPTGIPVQTSKNWHMTEGVSLLYQGSWIRGSARVAVPAKSTRRLRYKIVHTRWQGVPAASAGQLSLVGWGHNGFWTQMALGSWGENVCIQPGRQMRRAFLTDLRPMYVLDFKQGKPWGWTSNVGGGDSMVLVDREGRYQPWGAVVSRFEASGPNLAHVRVRERAANGSLVLGTDTLLPRGDDFVRVYFNLHLRVLEDVRFQRLVLFQLGSDLYNTSEPTTIAWGSGAERTKSIDAPAGEWEHVTRPAQLKGDHPWIALTGDGAKETNRLGWATRGLIVRQFRASIGGRQETAPWVAGYRTQHNRLNAELLLSPRTKRLRRGDSIDMQIELAVFPPSLDAYYGEDAGLREQLASHADTWRLTAWEADRNRPRLTVEGEPAPTLWPPTLSAEHREAVAFHLQGGAGMVPVRITGVASPTGWRLEEFVDGQSIPLGDRNPEERKPQVEHNPATNRYTVTLSLRASQAERRFRWFTSGEAAER